LFCVHQEHLSVALALSLPIVCVITKVDSTPPQVYEQVFDVKRTASLLNGKSSRERLTKTGFFLHPGERKTKTSAEPFDVPLPQVNDNGMACELAMGFAAEKACPNGKSSRERLTKTGFFLHPGERKTLTSCLTVCSYTLRRPSAAGQRQWHGLRTRDGFRCREGMSRLPSLEHVKRTASLLNGKSSRERLTKTGFFLHPGERKTLTTMAWLANSRWVSLPRRHVPSSESRTSRARASSYSHERDTVDVCDRELEIGVDGKHLGRVSWSDHVEEGLPGAINMILFH
jgi:hypothetical protein